MSKVDYTLARRRLEKEASKPRVDLGRLIAAKRLELQEALTVYAAIQQSSRRDIQDPDGPSAA